LHKGLYRDVANEIIEGACGPLLIHTNKTKTKEKEAEERVRQRSADTAEETAISPRWTVGIDNAPDVSVQTTSSGSMTQEVFMIYAKHFVSTLPPSHGPVILFLDGHGSCWNKYALKFLMDNKVFPFILASHTSIWLQPNDAGVNKRLHWAIEQECKKERQKHNNPTIPYCNTNFVKGWRHFLEAERNDIRLLGYNNATRAFWRTGLFPYDPFAPAWTNAIKTLGQAQPVNAIAQYEAFPIHDAPQLSESESQILPDGFDNENIPKEDVAMAYLRSSHILHQWREDITEAVKEGEDYARYSHVLLPSAKTDSEKIAMRLVYFKKIETNGLHPVRIEKSKEEKAAEITRQIIRSTTLSEPIFVTYLSSDSESDNDSLKSATGTACKLDMNKWRVCLKNKVEMIVTDEELMDTNKFFVEQKWQSSDSDETMRKKQAAKQKRVRTDEKLQQEKNIREKGLQKRREFELAEYNNMRKKFESGEPYEFEHFLEMVDLLRRPFVCQIDGHEVSLTQDDSTIMMEKSTIRAITESLFDGKEKRKCQNQDGNQNKRQNSGNPTVRTECGATGIVALYQTSLRNSRINQQALKQSKSKLDRESKNISTTLTSLAALKRKKPDNYWVFSLGSSQQELTMILCLSAPESGVLSKGKQEQWQFIEENLAPMLSQAAVDAKGEE